MFAMPAPVAAYQLPDGTFVASAEEYAAKMSEATADARAKAYTEANKEKFSKGQETRAYNVVKAFIMWEAGVQAVQQAAQQAAA